jgi:DNA-binding LacI/PurR family transcriptional regulator
MKKITARELAEKAGVSVGTVSRVINNLPGHSPETVARVRAAMYELGFRPPQSKITTAQKRVRQVALLFPDSAATPLGMVTPLGIGLAKGADAVLATQRQQLLVTQMRGASELPHCITRRQVEGVLLRNGTVPDALMEKLRALPCVRIFGTGPAINGMDVVNVDNYQLGRMAAEIILAERPRNVALLTHEHAFQDEFQLRLFGCRLALEEAGVKSNTLSLDLFHRQINELSQQGLACFIPGHDEDVSTVAEWLRQTRAFPAGKIVLTAAVTESESLLRDHPWIRGIAVRPEELGRISAQQLLWRMQHPHEAPRNVLVSPRLTITPAEV